MSDYQPVLQLDVPRDLPADELWDAVEFVYLVLLLYGTSLDPRLFQSVDHPHIQRISVYVKESLEEAGTAQLPKEQLQHRAKQLVEKLKTYCTIFLEDESNGPCLLVIKLRSR